MLWRAGSLAHCYLLVSTVHENVISEALASAHVIAAINFADGWLLTKNCCPSQTREMWERERFLACSIVSISYTVLASYGETDLSPQWAVIDGDLNDRVLWHFALDAQVVMENLQRSFLRFS